jgi:hypothetical protein
VNVREGQLWRSLCEIDAIALTHWFAPFTGGFECRIPADTVLVVLDDPPPHATGVGCRPVNYEELEAVLVPEEDRTAPKYGGYSISIKLVHFGESLTEA